jgi:phosphatidylserine/phosphatidylglycerophosphate/cardiolipin synthase-like enzyme
VLPRLLRLQGAAPLGALSFLVTLPGQPLSALELPGLAGAAIELVESVPVETPLDNPLIRNTPEVWREMIAHADSLIEIETFYVSADTAEELLDGVIGELESATRRGVTIRMLADAGFARTYPEMLAHVASLKHAEVRLLDVKRLWGGVLHAKCMAIDRDELFVGSQNWDWRSLEHVRELGIRIRHPGMTAAIGSILMMDWSLGRPLDTTAAESPSSQRDDASVTSTAPLGAGPFRIGVSRGDTAVVRLAASPPQALPPGIPWDEPLLVALIDSASKTLCAQVLTFDPVSGRQYHEALEGALKRAAARGVRVRLMLSNWNKRSGSLPYVKSLAATPGIEVRFSNLPEWSGGFIPYARVEHPKYAVADDEFCWIGTSNWTGEGFHGSRNLSVFISGGRLPATVGNYFETGWQSPFAEPVDPCADYLPPRIGE